MVDRREIKGKKIYILEKHNQAALPWAEIAQGCGKLVQLLTLDYHTDTRPAFTKYAGAIYNGKIGNPDYDDLIDEARNGHIEKVEKNNSVSVKEAVCNLKDDEQIDFAIRVGILSHAYVIAREKLKDEIMSNEYIEYSKECEKPEHALNSFTHKLKKPEDKTYSLPSNKIIVLDDNSFELVNYLSGDAREKASKDIAIESKFLAGRIDKIKTICKTADIESIDNGPYILDIDLDYFNTRKSIEPDDPEEFYKLIREAEAITIAKESSCVESLQHDDENLTSDYLLEKLLEHIKKALN